MRVRAGGAAGVADQADDVAARDRVADLRQAFALMQIAVDTP